MDTKSISKKIGPIIREKLLEGRKFCVISEKKGEKLSVFIQKQLDDASLTAWNDGFIPILISTPTNYFYGMIKKSVKNGKYRMYNLENIYETESF